MQVQIFRDIPFPTLERIEEECVLKVSQDPSTSFLLAFEPQATFTSGVSALPSDLLWDETQLKDKQIAVVPVSRGGKWTYHGPGQIILFPIFQMKSLGLSDRATKEYVELLTKSVQQFLEKHGISSEVRPTPYGIYVENKKICSFGVRVTKGVTSHGLALYYGPQNEAFQGIHPCGQPQAKMTSLLELKLKLTWIDATNQLIESLKSVVGI